MIAFQDFSFSYFGSDTPILRRLNLSYSEGEFALICGPTGSGKSTFLKTLNGLAPHFTGGKVSGTILANGRISTGLLPHELAEVIGYVNQQPEGAFVADTVEDEIAYGLEQLGVEPKKMLELVKHYASLVGVEQLLDQALGFLSGGEQQRVAIAAALAAGQRILVLDEPTSALDPATAEQILLVLSDLTKNHGITVLLAEHRIERLLELVDSVTVVHGDGSVTKTKPAEAFNNYRMVPPMVELGQIMNWQPLPISIAEARSLWISNEQRELVPGKNKNYRESSTSARVALKVEGISVSYGSQVALEPTDLKLFASEVLAVMGHNGSGKTSLLWAVQGSGTKQSGQVMCADKDTSKMTAQERLGFITMVPQNAADLLFLNTLADELAESDRFANVAPSTTATIFASLAGRVDPKRHPRDLSAGQQLALVLALQLVKGANVLLLDEPTRGLDYEAKRELAKQLAILKDQGKAVLLASHDIEFVAQVADRIVVLEKGRIVESGTPGEVLAFGKPLASQIAQIVQQPGAVCLSDIIEGDLTS